MSVQIHNEPPGSKESSQGSKVDGLIRFLAIRRNSKTTLANEMKGVKKYFDEFLGLQIKQLVSSDTAPAYNRFLFSRYELYKVASKKNSDAEQELRLVVLGDKEWYIILFLLTPAENDNLYVWACNTQAFNLIVKNLR